MIKALLEFERFAGPFGAGFGSATLILGRGIIHNAGTGVFAEMTFVSLLYLAIALWHPTHRLFGLWYPL